MLRMLRISEYRNHAVGFLSLTVRPRSSASFSFQAKNNMYKCFASFVLNQTNQTKKQHGLQPTPTTGTPTVDRGTSPPRTYWCSSALSGAPGTRTSGRTASAWRSSGEGRHSRSGAREAGAALVFWFNYWC